MVEPVWRWALPPLSRHAGAGERHRRHCEETALVNQIRWRWTACCSTAELTQRVVPTGFGSREAPLIGPIALGPPTRFSVELRPGMLREDFLDVRRRIASAFEVDDVDVRDLARGWITIELVEHGVRQPCPEPSRDERGPGPQRPPIAPGGRHLPRRRRRGPTGRPRLGR